VGRGRKILRLYPTTELQGQPRASWGLKGTPGGLTMTDKRPKYNAGKSGKYTCTRCGWKWTPRDGCPDPPRACARCRTAYWQTAPMSSRANSPEDPKWKRERDLASRRRRERHLARLRELAAEFNLAPLPIEDGGAIPPARGLHQPAASWIDSRDRFNDRVPPR
jgi:hypothetical protein